MRIDKFIRKNQNHIIILAILIITLLYINSFVNFIIFIASIILFYLAGYSFSGKRPSSVNVTIGISIISILSLISLLIKDYFIIATLGFLIFIFIGGKKIIKDGIPKMNINKKNLFFIFLAILLSAIVASPELIENNTTILTSSDSILYEVSASNSLELDKIQDISYVGKPIKWHLGIPALYSILNKAFFANKIQISYFVLFLFIILNMLNVSEVMSSLGMKKFKKIIPFVVIFFSHQIFPWTYFAPNGYFNILNRILLMNSFNFAFTIILALFAISLSKKKNIYAETVLLIGLAIVKFTLFATVIGGYIIFSIIMSIIDRKINFNYIPALIIGILNYIGLISGAHKHNKITFIPGEAIKFLLLKSSETFRNLGTIPQMIGTYFMTFIVSLEILWIGILFTFKRSFLYIKKNIFSKKARNDILLSCVFLSGLVLFIFVNEISETNSIQFLLPVILISAIISWYLIFTYIASRRKPLKIFLIIFIIIILFVNFSPSNKDFTKNDIESSNLLEKLSMDFLSKYNYLRSKAIGLISFGKIKSGANFSRKYNSFDRELFQIKNRKGTTITDLQTIVNCNIGYPTQTISASTNTLQYQESLYERGAISEKDYLERVQNNLRFFAFLTQNSTRPCTDMDNKYKEISTKYNQEDNSYYTKPQYFVNIFTSEIIPMNETEAKLFIKKNNISLILSHRSFKENITSEIKTVRISPFNTY